MIKIVSRPGYHILWVNLYFWLFIIGYSDRPNSGYKLSKICGRLWLSGTMFHIEICIFPNINFALTPKGEREMNKRV
jgi:hypothetical protein